MRRLGAFSIVALVSCSEATAPDRDGAIHVECDLGAGLQIIGGNCVEPMPIVEGPCPRGPAAGMICVTGTLYDFLTLQPLKAGDRRVRVVLTDALCLHGFGPPGTCDSLPQAIVENGSYTFPNIPAPGVGSIVLAVGDPNATSPQVLEMAAVAVQVEAGKSYTLDAFVVTRKEVDDWSAQAGRDFHSSGAYVAFFYDAPVPDWTLHLIPNEVNPVAGVQITDTGTPVTAANYFDPVRGTIRPSLTATGSVGGGLVSGGSGGLVSASGRGGTCGSPCVWERMPGGSIRGVVAIQAFHNCALSPTAPTCQ